MKGLGIIIAIIVIVLIAGGYFLFMLMQNTNKGTGGNSGNIGTGGSTGGNSGGTGEDIGGNTGTPQTHNVEISGFAFNPSTLTIKKGDTVIWTNKDSVSHTVTIDSENELASGLISNGQTYSHTFNTAGTYNYHCTPHPYMEAKIIVE